MNEIPEFPQIEFPDNEYSLLGAVIQTFGQRVLYQFVRTDGLREYRYWVRQADGTMAWESATEDDWRKMWADKIGKEFARSVTPFGTNVIVDRDGNQYCVPHETDDQEDE